MSEINPNQIKGSFIGGGIAVPNIVHNGTVFTVPDNTQVSYASPIIVNAGGTIVVVGTGILVGIIT